MKPKNLRVSDHAIIRFLERVKKMEREEFEKEILDEKLIKIIKTLGDGEFPLSNGRNIAVVKCGVVVTIK